ncbi:MAG: lipopolysaccharide heptosyltransferase II [Candidatus Omnitrophota bacterium]|nr:lipopolysaccharide heptosyltransferase II [Candidatus Omnitrophota bacterium]
MMPDNRKERKKILIINVNWLGDVIFSSPFIRAVRKTYPDSYIACVTPPGCRDVLAANSRLDELIILDENGHEKSFLGKIRFALKLRKKRFDAAFILHRSFTRALMTVLAGIKERVGYDTKKRGALLTKRLAPPSGNIHKVEYFLKLAEAVGGDISKKNYEFFITGPDRVRAVCILEAAGINCNDRIAILNPGGNWEPKKWPAGRFSSLADTLIEKYGIKIVITGAERDKVLAGEISRGMKNKAVSLCGRTSIRELAAVLERAKLVISGDSGPMHIGVSVGTNVVALFGPTSAEITGPYGNGNYAIVKGNVNCEVPCYDSACNDNRCMKSITVGNVMDVIEDRGYLN